MYKLAQLKEAEVRGVVAALVDNGVLAVDSPEQFEKVASDTAAMLDGYDYDINDVAQAAQYSMQKTASADAVTEAMGELTMHKLAGDINDDEFNYIAAGILKEAGLFSDTPAEKVQKAAKGAVKKVKGTAEDAAKAVSKFGKKNAKTLKALGKGGAIAAALGAAGYGGKKLYDSLSSN